MFSKRPSAPTPNVLYLFGSPIASIELREQKHVLMIQPRGMLRNDGHGDTTIQEAWIEAAVAGRNYRLDIEKGWEPEFIGLSLSGRGGQVEVYPGFFTPISVQEEEIIKDQPINAGVRIKVWGQGVIDATLGSLWIR